MLNGIIGDIAIQPERFQIQTQRILSHPPRLFHRIDFRHEAGQCGTSDNVTTFLGRLEKHCEGVGSVCCHARDYITYRP